MVKAVSVARANVCFVCLLLAHSCARQSLRGKVILLSFCCRVFTPAVIHAQKKVLFKWGGASSVSALGLLFLCVVPGGTEDFPPPTVIPPAATSHSNQHASVITPRQYQQLCVCSTSGNWLLRLPIKSSNVDWLAHLSINERWVDWTLHVGRQTNQKTFVGLTVPYILYTK